MAHRHVDTLWTATKLGYLGVWKLIWYNILAFAARIVFGIWVGVAFIAGYLAEQMAPGTGLSVGSVVFFTSPLAWGAWVMYAGSGDSDWPRDSAKPDESTGEL